MSHWWAGIPAVEVPVLCGGDTHTVRWEAGELIAVDHGDLESEVTPPALAGETVPCLELLRTWSRRADDPHVLTLASRGPTDPLNINLDGLRFDYRGLRRQTEEQTVRLLTAGGRLPDRLQATTAAIWTRRLRTGHAQLETVRPQLEAALYGRGAQNAACVARRAAADGRAHHDRTRGAAQDRPHRRRGRGLAAVQLATRRLDARARGHLRPALYRRRHDRWVKLDPGHTRPRPRRSHPTHDRYPVAQTTNARGVSPQRTRR
jgi:hypothetical protein